MSSFGSQMRKRLNELRKAGQNVPKIIHDVARDATVAAIEAAMNICKVSADGHLNVNNDTPPFNGKVI